MIIGRPYLLRSNVSVTKNDNIQLLWLHQNETMSFEVDYYHFIGLINISGKFITS